jgi:hypothetical protein
MEGGPTLESRVAVPVEEHGKRVQVSQRSAVMAKKKAAAKKPAKKAAKKPAKNACKSCK